MTTAERYLFDLRGYRIIEDVLKTEDLSELNRLLDGYDLWHRPRNEDLSFDSWDNDEHHMSAGPLHMWDEPFRRLIAHPAVVPYLADILGPRFRYDHGHAMLMTRGGRPLAATAKTAASIPAAPGPSRRTPGPTTGRLLSVRCWSRPTCGSGPTPSLAKARSFP